MRKIIDDRGRLFGVISVIDVIVLAVVAILVAAVLTKFNIQDTPIASTNTVRVVYTVKIPMIRSTTAALLRPGDNLYTDTGTFIGVIQGVNVEDAYHPEWLVDGTYVMGKVQERYDVTLTVEVQCSFSNGRYYADRVFELNADAEQKIQTKYVTTTGFFVTITAG
jgi:hypothetical protein